MKLIKSSLTAYKIKYVIAHVLIFLPATFTLIFRIYVTLFGRG